MEKEKLAKEYSKESVNSLTDYWAFIAGWDARQSEIDKMQEIIKDLCRLTTNKR